ncbi:hypothetical protein BRARA_I03570 [Brassica rapa]|uniref:F-box domain-containing protein n=1 Tax=Brassica campestris TaxID=3711 RepID=A0A397XZY4_BRACM|nr:hypothetical protein BRARA_I03570 [Brassica rapa]CAG7865346.1 unnamed protein product [Brassica rapa]VDC62423.1 unnamed protein product [Brassica rapa]
MNKDMISHLPEDLIRKILSFLPTKTAIATSLLSKQWRSHWMSAPKLRFDSEDYENEHDENFSKIVSESFLSHKAPVLESFHLRFGLDKVDPIDVGFWIGIAFARQLRKLVLDFLELQESFIFPSSLCTCKTLETLKLRNQILLDISSPASMKSLKKLHLSYVFYKDDETINNLLSGCPSLEELIVDRSDEHTVEFFTINVPSLLRLTIYDDNSEKEFLGYLIEAPSLKYLEIDELRCKLFLLEAPELVEANIYGVPAIISSEFHVSLTSVKRLVLDVSPLKTIYPPIGDIFNQLVYLEMYTREALWWDLLRRMLEHSPKLQVLKLVDEYRINPDYRVCGMEWKKPKYVPKCLLSHLETFVWTRYDARRENEEEVATYILKNAKQLKSANFSANPIKPKELKKLAERREMFRKLDGVVKASTSCHLVFK